MKPWGRYTSGKRKENEMGKTLFEQACDYCGVIPYPFSGIGLTEEARRFSRIFDQETERDDRPFNRQLVSMKLRWEMLKGDEE